MKIQFFGTSDIGKKREKNEDNYLINEKLGLCIVADGMGGHLGGARASKLAVTTMDEALSELLSDPDATIQEGFSINPDDLGSYLSYAIQMANKRIFAESAANGSLRGMGTTVVSMLFKDDSLYVAHVGDSRAYRITEKKIEQITKDHSLVEEQVEAGIISPADAKDHRFKNIITRSVGFEEDVEIDVSKFTPVTGEYYLMCSDGLSNLVEDEEIYDIINNNSLKNSGKRLIELANERGGDDNITVTICYVEEAEETEDDGEEPTIVTDS